MDRAPADFAPGPIVLAPRKAYAANAGRRARCTAYPPPGVGHVSRQGLSWATLGAIEVGSLVGAGFASGREVWEFFARFGVSGQAGVVLFALLIALTGGLLLDASRRNGTRSYRDLAAAMAGSSVARWIDLPIALSLFVGLAVTLAGAGELGRELGFSSTAAGTLGTAALTALVVSRRGGLEAASLSLVPLLIVLMLVASGADLRLEPAAWDRRVVWTGGVVHAALLYFLYNGLLCLVVFASLGRKVRNRRQGWWGALSGAAVLGMLALAVCNAETNHGAMLAHQPLPLLDLARGRAAWLGHVYILALAAALLTTAVGNAYGLVARLEEAGFKRGRSTWWVSLGAVPVALIGFVALVRYGYGIVAACGAMTLGTLGAAALLVRAPDPHHDRNAGA